MKQTTKDALQLIADYYTAQTLFKANGTKIYNIKDITKKMILDFKDKFIDKMNKNDFNEYFETKDNFYYIVSNAINNLLVVDKVKTTKKYIKDIKINNIDTKVYKFRNTIYLILEDSLVIFYTKKELCLGSVSINDNRFWYSHLSSITEDYLGINKFSDRKKLVDEIENKLRS